MAARDPVAAAQFDLKVCAAGLILLIYLNLLGAAMVQSPETGDRKRRPLPREATVRFHIPYSREEDWLTRMGNHPLCAESLQIVLCDGDQPLFSVPVDVNGTNPNSSWTTTFGSVELRTARRPYEHPTANTLETIEHLVIDLTLKFRDEPRTFPLQLTAFVRVRTPKPPADFPRELDPWWEGFAELVDELPEALAVPSDSYPAHAGIDGAIYPEGTSADCAIFPHLWIDGTAAATEVRLHVWNNSMPNPSVRATIEGRTGYSLTGFDTNCWTFHSNSYTPVGDVAHLELDLRLDVTVDREPDPDDPYAPPSVTARVRPTAAMIPGFPPRIRPTTPIP